MNPRKLSALIPLFLCLGALSVKAQAPGDTANVARHPHRPAESLVGEWRWVGPDIPELILVLDADSLGNIEVIHWKREFDETITLRRDYFEYDKP